MRRWSRLWCVCWPTASRTSRRLCQRCWYRTLACWTDCMSESGSVVVRRAGAADAETVLALVDALADYEKLTRPTAAAKQRLVADMSKRFDAWIAEVQGQP